MARYLEEEPTSGTAGDPACAEPAKCAKWQRYLAVKRAIESVDSTHPVFNVDSAWTDSDGHTDPRPWWLRWNTDAPISAHDNYPFPGLAPGFTQYGQATASLSRSQGIPETVSLAVSANKQRKPVWLCIQAFEGTAGPTFFWNMPSARQLRAQAFAGIIHGATGIIYFALDAMMALTGVGIAPHTQAATGPYTSGPDCTTPAASGTEGNCALYRSPEVVSASRELWNASARLNEQLEALRPAILSPTADVDYSVAFVGHNFSHTPIRALLKASPTGLVLLAVNLDASGPLLVRFSFEPGVLGANVSALFEPGKQALTVENTTDGEGFVDSFEAFGTHAYRLG